MTYGAELSKSAGPRQRGQRPWTDPELDNLKQKLPNELRTLGVQAFQLLREDGISSADILSLSSRDLLDDFSFAHLASGTIRLSPKAGDGLARFCVAAREYAIGCQEKTPSTLFGYEPPPLAPQDCQPERETFQDLFESLRPPPRKVPRTSLPRKIVHPEKDPPSDPPRPVRAHERVSGIEARGPSSPNKASSKNLSTRAQELRMPHFSGPPDLAMRTPREAPKFSQASSKAGLAPLEVLPDSLAVPHVASSLPLGAAPECGGSLEIASLSGSADAEPGQDTAAKSALSASSSPIEAAFQRFEELYRELGAVVTHSQDTNAAQTLFAKLGALRRYLRQGQSSQGQLPSHQLELAEVALKVSHCRNVTYAGVTPVLAPRDILRISESMTRIRRVIENSLPSSGDVRTLRDGLIMEIEMLSISWLRSEGFEKAPLALHREGPAIAQMIMEEVNNFLACRN